MAKHTLPRMRSTLEGECHHNNNDCHWGPHIAFVFSFRKWWRPLALATKSWILSSSRWKASDNPYVLIEVSAPDLTPCLSEPYEKSSVTSSMILRLHFSRWHWRNQNNSWFLLKAKPWERALYAHLTSVPPVRDWNYTYFVMNEWIYREVKKHTQEHTANQC